MNPYKPWLVLEKEYPQNRGIDEKLRYIIRYALLAPSSHNTQPWKFKVKNNVVDIIPDYMRTLPYSDRKLRELFISLGCALKNLIVAGEHFGFTLTIKYFPEDSMDDACVRVVFSESTIMDKDKYNLFFEITKRKTNRFMPMNKDISQKILSQFENIEKPINIYSDFIRKTYTKTKISKIMYEAIEKAFCDKVFKHELSLWIRSVFTNKQDGIPLFDANLPGLITLMAPYLIKSVPAAQQASLDKKLVNRSPVLLVISSDIDNKINWIKAGEYFQTLALFATKYDMTLAPMAAIVEQEESCNQLKKIINRKENILFFARLCYPVRSTHESPRRPLEEVLVM